MKKTVYLESPLVEASWLKDHQDAGNLIILDATLPKAVTTDKVPELRSQRIPGARFFDIKNTFSETTAPFPNTWPGEVAFNREARKIGINNESAIVVYDQYGIYSSARAWWMFRSMGHQNVAVLNGGLKSWIAADYNIEDAVSVEVDYGNFNKKFNKKFFKSHRDVLENIGADRALLMDARAANRFDGSADEPREGLRSGHVPGSVNLPYSDLLNEDKMLDKTALKKMISSKAGESKKLMFTCGSGITACILSLAAELAGYSDLSVYDGSWTEWGSLNELPIEKGN